MVTITVATQVSPSLAQQWLTDNNFHSYTVRAFRGVLVFDNVTHAPAQFVEMFDARFWHIAGPSTLVAHSDILQS